MKAILVIDLPKNCAECKLMYLQGIGESICNAVDWEERPLWCPLKPMPEKLYVEANRIEDVMPSEFDMDKFVLKIQLDTDKLFAVGWNACLEEIEK